MTETSQSSEKHLEFESEDEKRAHSPPNFFSSDFDRIKGVEDGELLEELYKPKLKSIVMFMLCMSLVEVA